jgi:hypothetical protein
MLETSHELRVVFKEINPSVIDLINGFNKLSQMRFLGWVREVKYMAL